jgi:hypothetical protein
LPPQYKAGFLSYTHIPYLYGKVPGKLLPDYDDGADSKPWTFLFRRLKYDVESSIKAIDIMKISDTQVVAQMKDRLKRGW